MNRTNRFSFALCMVMLLLLAAPQNARSERRRSRSKPRAAVTIVVKAKQVRAKRGTLHSLVIKELGKHGIAVKRTLIPSRTSRQKRRLAAYARSRRLKRVYELQVRPRGKKLLVTLADRRVPRMRSSFQAKLSVSHTGELEAAIPRLVEAVVRRTRPRPARTAVNESAGSKTAVKESAVGKTAAGKTAAGKTAAGKATVQDTTVRVAAFTDIADGKRSGSADASLQARPSASSGRATRPGREILYGFSLEPGTFLTDPAGLFGGSAKIFYQVLPYRYGLELSGMRGDGSLVGLSARAQYLFRHQSKIAPVVGLGLSYLFLSKGEEEEGNGGAFLASVGAQFSELVSWTRMVVEAEFLLPFFSLSRFDFENDNGIVEPVTRSSWNPAVVLKVSCLF